MAWQIVGTYWSACSCKVACPCLFGELEADQGWCSGFLAFDIGSGSADGADIGGARVALVGDWPSGFLSGNGTGRLYFDPSVPEDKHAALEAILSGQKGGDLGALSALVPTWLPSKVAPVSINQNGDQTKISVGDVGVGVITPLKTEDGRQTRVLNGAAAFGDDTSLAKGLGSKWSDPDTRSWESAGHAEFAQFDWKG